MPGHVFSEKEAGEILQHAVRLQEQGGVSDYTPGVTYDELVRIAAEAGIDKDYLRQAIESPTETAPKTSLFNLMEEQDKVLDGELDDDGLQELMDQIRGIVKLQHPQTFGKSIEAQAWRGPACGTLRVSSKRGRTRIAFRQTPFIAYFTGLHVPLILSLILGLALGMSGNILPAILVPLALLTAGGSVFYAVAQAGKRKAREILSKIVGLAQAELGRGDATPAE